ncbi:MAG: cobalamin-binding protein [Sphingobacteriales bacterium]|nr:MAG: cobalamin-binding protein [Sphingobacteriales bacterium]
MPLLDPFGHELKFSRPPQRIVSLVPSQTELLSDLGLDAEVAGITKFCIHPDSWFRSKPRIGGTKTVDIDKVAALEPDLVLANKEENVREQVEALAKKIPTWASDISTLEQALDAIRNIGVLVHREKRATSLAREIEGGFEGLGAMLDNRPRAAYLIWKDPYMSVGADTFIHDMLERLGVQNVFAGRTRYPEVAVGELLSCNLVLLSSEPYPFAQKHIDELQAQLPNARIVLVDGELFSWYGSRLLHTPAYFAALRRDLGIFSIE